MQSPYQNPSAQFLSQTWFPTVQLVLQALWQEAWHSPQPPVLSDFCIDGLFTVLMCFIVISSLQESTCILSCFLLLRKNYFIAF